MEQKQLHVRVEQACLVKPAQPTAVKHHMYLSTVDMLTSVLKPSRTILFYPAYTNSSATTASEADRHDEQPQLLLQADDAFSALRRGLAAALVPYYPFAGRLTHIADGRLVLHCNDAGVELILARCDDIPFSALASHNFLPRPFFRRLVPMDDLPRSDHVDTPVTSVQLTAFHGGFTLGIASQHSVADGLSCWTFIQALGQACRGKLLFTLPAPLHYRGLLNPETFNMLNRFPPKPAPQKQDIVPCAADNSYSYSVIDDSSNAERRLLQVVVHFSKEMIDKLKKACAVHFSSNLQAQATAAGGCCISSKHESTSFSTYQALSAYLWKRFIMARGSDDSEAVQLLHLLDIRHRIVPPLTSAFCGNAIAGIVTSSTAKVIKEESLGETAARIRQTLREVDDYWIKRFLTEANNPDLPNIVSDMSLFCIRNASRFPVYQAGDFGWGQPVAVRPPISCIEKEPTWYPGKKLESIDVVFALLDTTCASFFAPDLYGANDPLDMSLFAPTQLPNW